MNLEPKIFFDLAAKVLSYLGVKTGVNVLFIIVHPNIRTLQMLRVSKQQQRVVQSHAKIPDSLESLEFSEYISEHDGYERSHVV